MRRLAPLLALAIASPVQAGLYTETERVHFEVGADGVARALPYEPQFKDLLDSHLMASDSARPAEVNGKLTPRGELLNRLKTATGLELAALEVRGGFAERALSVLAPRARDRVPDFVALITLAQAHAARGEWPEAARVHAAAFFDATPPATLPGANREQTQWLLQVEKVYVKRWIALRRREAALPREQTLDGGPPELFPGVAFAQLGGSPEGKAKLPPDAVPIVQQLLLWSPGDTGLLWLLGELYAAKGEVRAASKVFDQCTWGRSYTNRPVLMAHRQTARAAVDALPPETVDAIPEPAKPEEVPPEPARTTGDLARAYWPVPVGLGAVTAIMILLQVRSWRKRVRR